MPQYDNRRESKMSSSRRNSNRYGGSRRQSFILVAKHEEEEMNEYSTSFIGHLGLPILYVLSCASILSGIICMGIVTTFWANLQNPTCFLYSKTPSMSASYLFGTSISCCYWVAYGAIPALVIVSGCGFLYVYYVRDDKDVTTVTYVCVIGIIVATIFMLAVTCTLTQGLRITCIAKSINLSNAGSCKEKLDGQIDNVKPPIKTSTMVAATMGAYWLGTCGLILITLFHIALIIDNVKPPIKTSTMVAATMGAYWLGTCGLILITLFHIALIVRRKSAY